MLEAFDDEADLLKNQRLRVPLATAQLVAAQRRDPRLRMLADMAPDTFATA